ncbi:MAG: hypothetical protein ACI9MR_003299 [Myxococcota bacterium]|jgi:hypothetical protein
MSLFPSVSKLGLTLLSAAFLLACGDSGDPNPDQGTADTETAAADTVSTASGDTATDTADTVVPTDTGENTPDTTPNGACDKSGFAALTASFQSPQQGIDVYQGATSEDSPSDLMAIEFYRGTGSDAATGPGTIDLTGSNYETCNNCVLIRTGCGAQTCEKTFYADTGSLVITGWSEETGFAGNFDGVVLKEVTIDSTTYRSTPVVGGETWCLDGASFNAAIVGFPMGGEDVQETCVAEGTGTLLGDNIADFGLTNCNGDMVNLHDSCGAPSKALLLIGTAMWCQACEDLLAGIVADHGGTLDRAIVDDRSAGMDMLVVLGENLYGEKPSMAECQSYAAGNKLDPAMVLIDNRTEGVVIPLPMAPGSGLEVNSFGTTWEYANPYLPVSGDSVTVATPWLMVFNGTNMAYAWSDQISSETLNTALSALLTQE